MSQHKEDKLIEASRKALELLKGDLATVLECNCLLNEKLEPIRETMDERAEADVEEMEAVIAELEAALAGVSNTAQ